MHVKNFLSRLKASLKPMHVVILGIACAIVLAVTTPLVFYSSSDKAVEDASYINFTTNLFEAKREVAEEIGYTGNIDYLKVYSAGGNYSYRLLDADEREIESGNFTSQTAIAKMNEALKYGDHYDEASSGFNLFGVAARSFFEGLVYAGLYLILGAIIIFLGCAILMTFARDNVDKTAGMDNSDGTSYSGNADAKYKPTRLLDLLKATD